MTNLMHWRLLVAVAESGCISKAAEQCGITQSGASQAISQIEDTLNVQIFVRDRRGTVVTAIGERIIERARRMVSEWQSIRALADASRGLHAGRIRLASFPSVFSALLPRFLRSFEERHPGIEIVLLEGTDEEVAAWLESGTVDAGVVMNPPANAESIVLGRDAWKVVVPDRHPFARRACATGLALADIVDEPFVLVTGECWLNSRKVVENAGFELSDVPISVRSWSTAFALVREGMGVSLVPGSLLPESGDDLRVLGLDTPIHRVFSLVCADASGELPAMPVFLNALREFGQHNSRLTASAKGAKGRRGRNIEHDECVISAPNVG